MSPCLLSGPNHVAHRPVLSVLSFDPIPPSPPATHESFRIVLLTSVPFSTITQRLSKDPSVSQVTICRPKKKLSPMELRINTLPEGCTEDHLRAVISPHTSCTITIKPPTSPSVQSSSAILIYPTEEAAIAAFRASSTWMVENEPIKAFFKFQGKRDKHDGRKHRKVPEEQKEEKQGGSSPPSPFSCGSIPAKALSPPSPPPLQPFRVIFSFDATGYPGAMGVQEGEEVLVSEEMADGWSVVCWPDGTERGIVPSSYIERLNKLTNPPTGQGQPPPPHPAMETAHGGMETEGEALTPQVQQTVSQSNTPHHNPLLPTPNPQSTPNIRLHQVSIVTRKWRMRQTLRAVDNYSAPTEQPNCLSLRAGQIVTLVEFGDEWCRVRDYVANGVD
ncbi:hypothetical protein BLNAU_12450 [Blattamonas nauphoetae]|uniref:SH3 domain-containing protein n=1 Tax=Blattamonas nauphoetae TaxID=2049346 RepID=A0ABQ9XMK2_9EUKA|nr:hypothetical protein BLNAU_12450 [Blattamonas nauphoetae]